MVDLWDNQRIKPVTDIRNIRKDPIKQDYWKDGRMPDCAKDADSIAWRSSHFYADRSFKL